MALQPTMQKKKSSKSGHMMTSKQMVSHMNETTQCMQLTQDQAKRNNNK